MVIDNINTFTFNTFNMYLCTYLCGLFTDQNDKLNFLKFDYQRTDLILNSLWMFRKIFRYRFAKLYPSSKLNSLHAFSQKANALIQITHANHHRHGVTVIPLYHHIPSSYPTLYHHIPSSYAIIISHYHIPSSYPIIILNTTKWQNLVWQLHF